MLGKHIIGYLKTDMAEIEDGKHCRGARVTFAKSVNLP